MSDRAQPTTTTLLDRDRAVVELVGKFRQMTRRHIQASLFADLASPTPLDRTLKRLVEQKHLSRLKRLIGGDHGGSGQFVYQLGRQGWRLLNRHGAFWAPRAVNLHTLAIADCYVALKNAERRGEIEVICFTTEPECHQVVGDVLLTPDAYLEIGQRVERVKNSYWLEVDRGTEHISKIQEKAARYWRGYRNCQDDHYPSVRFVVPDVRRKREIEHAITSGPAEAIPLFSVQTRESLN